MTSWAKASVGSSCLRSKIKFTWNSSCSVCAPALMCWAQNLRKYSVLLGWPHSKWYKRWFWVCKEKGIWAPGWSVPLLDQTKAVWVQRLSRIHLLWRISQCIQLRGGLGADPELAEGVIDRMWLRNTSRTYRGSWETLLGECTAG